MAKLKLNVIAAIAVVGLAVSLWFLGQARATLRERDEQVQRLRDRTAQLENKIARHSSASPFGLTAEEREAYLSLSYKEFDATPGSGHRRFRDQPRDPAQAGALIEAYLERHTDLPLEQRRNLQGHAAQMFALGGMNERAITHLDRLLAQTPGDWWADATKAFLLFDRERLLAVRQQMAGREATIPLDFLLERFGESYADGALWEPLSSTITLPVGASPEHRAASEKLAQAFGTGITRGREAPTEGGIPGDCLWLEVRSMGGTPDVEGYIILHANKSTVITATNEQWLDAAVKRLIESARLRNGKWQAPFGLATSFQLAR